MALTIVVTGGQDGGDGTGGSGYEGGADSGLDISSTFVNILARSGGLCNVYTDTVYTYLCCICSTVI